MLSTRSNRLDPSLIPEGQLADVARAFEQAAHVALVDQDGQVIHPLPDVLFQHFARIVRMMSERRAIVLLPEDETFTTQAAANYLGMSRQHLVSLLDANAIPYHKVGTHRRITFKNLMAYEKQRDISRRAALDKLSAEVDAAGLYDSDYSGDQK